MSKQRVIKDEMWDDEWFYDLGPSEKLLWVFLLTNPRSNIAGIYKINIRWVSQTTGFDKDVVKNMMGRFKKDKKILYEDDWIAIMNFHKHLPYRNENIAKGIKRLYEENKDYTKALKGFESVWVTLLNSTLLYLSDIPSKDGEILSNKKKDMFKAYDENNPYEEKALDMDGEEIKKPKPVKKHNEGKKHVQFAIKYIEYRKFNYPKDSVAFWNAVGRYMKPAALLLENHTGDEIVDCMEWCAKNYKEWSLETVVKKIDEYKNA